MANVMKSDKQALAIRLLCEGNSVRSTSRILGCHKSTVASLILSFGEAAHNFLDERLRGLKLGHVEVDEIWSYVGKKQARLTTEEKELRGDVGDVYLWTCIDQDSKLIASYAVGKRSADMARRLMVDLASRVEIPKPHASDRHRFFEDGHKLVVQISTDGFPAYAEAIDLAFGPYAKHGIIIKEYRNATMQYTPSEMVGTVRRTNDGIDPWSICTSHIERHNLTTRTFMKRFNRLTLGFSKSFRHHSAAIAMFLAYYDFVWRTRYPDGSGKEGKLRPTAAMMAGLVDNLWSFDMFFDTVRQYEGTPAW